MDGLTASKVVKQEADGEREDVDTQPRGYHSKGLVWVCSTSVNLKLKFRVWGKQTLSYQWFMMVVVYVDFIYIFTDISLWEGTLQRSTL